MNKIKRALEVVVRRLRDEHGKYDIEAAWTIGVLASELDVPHDEVEAMGIGFATVIFVSPGQHKIPAIRCIRTHANLGLRDAKAVVDGERSCSLPIEKAKAIKEECENQYGSNVIVRTIPLETPPLPPTLPARGIDISDD